MENMLSMMLLGEGLLQARLAIRADLLLTEANALPRGVERTERRWLAVQSLLSSAANVHKTLWTGARQQDDREREIAERQPIREAFGLENESSLGERKVRNALEHFGENITDMWERLAAQGAEHGTLVLRLERSSDGGGFAIRLGPVPEFQAPLEGLIEYVADTGIVRFRDPSGNREIKLAELISECRLIDRNADKARETFGDLTGPGGTPGWHTSLPRPQL